MKTAIYLITIVSAILGSCTGNNDVSDAYGNFEANEILVPAEVQGRILSFGITEGRTLNVTDTVGLIDTTQLYLQKEQLKARIAALSASQKSTLAQADVYRAQRKNVLIEQERLEKLLADGAATQQQMDNINGQLDVLESQIVATLSQINSIQSEIRAVETQVEQVNDQINKCFIINPVRGTVLEKYVEPFELAIPGKALYKIANLDLMDLRVYVSGKQLPDIYLGQQVKVFIDKNEAENQEMPGKLTWISDRAEFTPKIIQTKEERVNLVYAVKIEVPNDGRIKIGMPGEVRWE